MAMLRDLIGQIPGNYGRGQGAFKSSSGNLIKLSDLGWQDTESGEMLAPNTQGQQSGPNPTYANPIDYMGKKGFLQPDGSIQFDGGGMLESPAVRQAKREQQVSQRAEEEFQLKRAKAIAELEKTQRETANIGKKPNDGSNWKYDAGSDTWVAPPDENNPMGKMTQPQSKLNAAKSLDYVAGELGESLKNTPQGGFMGLKGYIGRVTDSQEGKRFDNLKEQLSTELRTLFRIPGEGALSDKEQAQYGVQLPDVTKDQATNESIVKDIRNRVALRLGQPAPGALRLPQPSGNLADMMREAEAAIAAGAPRDAVMRRLMEQRGGR